MIPVFNYVIRYVCEHFNGQKQNANFTTKLPITSCVMLTVKTGKSRMCSKILIHANLV
jgi:hypothetical protein